MSMETKRPWFQLHVMTLIVTALMTGLLLCVTVPKIDFWYSDGWKGPAGEYLIISITVPIVFCIAYEYAVRRAERKSREKESK